MEIMQDHWQKYFHQKLFCSLLHFQNVTSLTHRLFVYGGYQILNGNMADFYSIDLDDDVEKFNWVPIEAKGQLPGPRSKHALVGAKGRIYLVGGLCTDLRSSSQIHSFDPLTKVWTLMKPEGESLPEIDSFGCVYLEREGEERIVIVGGWNGEKAEYLNSVYEYNITKNRLSILFEGSPEPREGTLSLMQECRLPAAAALRPPTARTSSCSGARTPNAASTTSGSSA